MKPYVSGASSLALLLLAACAAPNPKPSVEPAPWQPPVEKKASATTEAVASPKDFVAPSKDSPAAPHTGESVVATVAGKPIYVSELLSQLLYVDTLRLRDMLMKLAIARLMLAEAARLHVVIDPDAASKAYEEAIGAMENEFRKSEIGRKYPKMTLDNWIERQLGLDPIRYRERMREDALRAVLLDRVTRAWILQQEHAEIRLIVMASEDELKAAQQDLEGGKSFDEVALARSVDPSKKEGGAMLLVRNSTPLSKAVFDAPIGTLSNPVKDRGAWMLFRVEARPTPLEGEWASIGPAVVEASLKKYSIDQTEAEQWLRGMTTRHGVDTAPFLELVGEAKR